MRCPITNDDCTKKLDEVSSSIFIGYQFKSDYYKTTSLKEILINALKNFNLHPFFLEEHFEPHHISCEICFKIRESPFCIFEISDSNPNVMFELGLSYMAGKVSIIISRHGSNGTTISDIDREYLSIFIGLELFFIVTIKKSKNQFLRPNLILN